MTILDDVQPTRESTSVRDIPRCCSCEWDYRTHPARWVLTRPDPACIWHQRNGGTP